MRNDGASGELRIGEWVPAPRREPSPATPHSESAPTAVPRGEAAPTAVPRGEPAPTVVPRGRPAPAAPYGAVPGSPVHPASAPVVPRTEPVPPVPGWVEAEETVALPAFLRGLAAPGAVAAATDPTAPLATLPAPVSAQPMTSTGRHAVADGPAAHPLPGPVTAGPAPDADGGESRLPSSERNMLIFVSSLLAAGTLAIVAMGHGALEKRSGSPATITIVPSASASAGTSLVGSPDVRGYCDGLDGHLTSRPPGAGRTTWSCTGAGHAAVSFTPTDVCRAQYGPSAHAVYTTLSDTKTWHCLR